MDGGFAQLSADLSEGRPISHDKLVELVSEMYAQLRQLKNDLDCSRASNVAYRNDISIQQKTIESLSRSDPKRIPLSDKLNTPGRDGDVDTDVRPLHPPKSRKTKKHNGQDSASLLCTDAPEDSGMAGVSHAISEASFHSADNAESSDSSSSSSIVIGNKRLRRSPSDRTSSKLDFYGI